MRIVIDMQGAQTENRFRGIGRYTMAFAQAVIRNRGEHEVVLALSGLFPDTIESIRAAFEGLLPQESIRVWHAPGPVREVNVNNCGRHDIAKLLRSRFFTSLQPDIVHIPSLFEGYVDDAVTSVGGFDKKTLVSVTVHDLIPLLNPVQYLAPSPGYKKYYLHQVDSLKEVNIFLAVSESSRRELIDGLGFDGDSIINASGGVDSDFGVIAGGDAFSSLRVKFGLNLPFVLYTGGTDERKNLPRLIEAWSFLPSVLRQQHQLVFAGKMPQNAVGQLTGLASRHGLRGDELRFTGYVDDEELIQLYNLCELFVFPSWHEGFGLPALEAMACGAPVIGANTSSLPEVIGLESALFDPFDVMQMRDKIVQALTDDAFRASLRSHGKEQCKRFSWDSTAQRAIQAWEGAVAAAGTAAPAGAMARRWPRLIEAIAPALGSASPEQLASLAAHIARNERAGIERQLMVDISEICQRDAATGVQRVVRSYLRQLLQHPPAGFRVEPVYATRSEGYRYARSFATRFLGHGEDGEEDRPIQWQRGDIFFGLDLQHHVQLAHARTYRQLRQDGVVVKFLVHDLLPIRLADSFKDDGAKALHERWLRMIVAQDAAICISSATAEALTQWMSANAVTVVPGFGIDCLQLYQSASHPPSHTMPWLSWRQSCEQLKTALTERHYRRRQLLVDISQLAEHDSKTGIQRVVRSVLLEWLRHPPQHYRVEPVYAKVNGPYRYARQFTQRFLNLSDHGDAEDAVVEYSPGDRFFGLDLHPQVAAAHAGTYHVMRANGVHVLFLVHDLLPVRTPEYFELGARESFEGWLNVVTGSDGAICVSRTVAEDLGDWISEKRLDKATRFRIDWFHNGADIVNSGASAGLPPNATEVLYWLRQRVSFLMVGTLEPRKGHQQVLNAFELLWRTGVDANLVVVGKVGWMVKKLAARMRNHPERSKRFFWLDGISDEYLELVYGACNCLIAASYGEGFGLPLIESAQHRLPVMARDIPVFREVAGPHAYYFSAMEPEQLAQAVRDWLDLYQREQHPASEKMPWLTWQQSAQVLFQKIMGVN